MLTSVVLLVASLLVPLATPAMSSTQSEAEAIAQVRGLVRAQDPHSAYRAGTTALATHADSAELRAWWLLAAVRSDRDEEAMAAAAEFVQEHPDEGWAWFALAGVQAGQRDQYQQSPDSSARALELLGNHPDVLWLHAQTLITADRYEEALSLTEGPWRDPELAAAMWRQRARALYYLAGFRQPDPVKRAQALAADRKAVELAPDSADANLGLGSMLSILGQTTDAAEYLQRAQQLSPGSIRIRQQLWQSIVRRADLEPDDKLAMLKADMDDLFQRHERSPAALMAAHGTLRSVDAPDLRNALADEILTRHPDSSQAEWIAVSRYREIADEFYAWARQAQAEDVTAEPDPKLIARYRAALREFLARERFHNSRLRGDAYRNLFTISNYGGGVPAEQLLEIVDGMVAYEGINIHISHAGGAIALAERTSYYDRAEQIARAGFDAGRAKLERQRWTYDTQANFDKALNWILSIMHDALGWVLFQSDRIDEAEPELTQAHQLDPANLTNLHHLGQLEEHNGDRSAAERFYILGLNVQRPGTNPNRQALETLYQRDHDALDGFDDYVERIAAHDADTRHAEILSSRITNPEPPSPFDLATLDGGSIAVDELRGKIAVINFWGIWCYWCVVEMPELQRLHEKYADDPDVVILTINNDPNPDQVPPWMEENGYSFPVLLDDGYVAGAEISGFPTTWFLDPEGRVAFIKRNWSQELLQEYSWRIEAIRERAATR